MVRFRVHLLVIGLLIVGFSVGPVVSAHVNGSVVISSTTNDDWPDNDYREVQLGSYSGEIQSSDDSDRFKISVSKGQVLNLELAKDAGDNVEASVSAPGISTSLFNNGGTSDSDEITIEDDGYVYVEVTGEPSESAISWTVSVTDNGATDEWNDNDYEQVDLGTRSGAINSDYDEDRFKIPVSKGQVLDLALSKDAGDNVEVSVSAPGISTSLFNNGGTSDSDQITVEDDGFVHVEVTGDATDSDFSWSVSVTDNGATDEWNDNDYEQVDLGTRSGAINSDYDEDRFKVSVSKGQVLDLALSKDAGDNVEVSVSAPGISTSLFNNGGTSDSDEITIEDDGFVHVEVTGDATDSDFSWSVSVTDNGATDEWDDNDYEQVDLGTRSGAINSDHDEDRFKIPVSQGQVLDLTLSKDAGENVEASISAPGISTSLFNNGGTSDSDQITVEDDGFVRVEVIGEATDSDFPWTVSVQPGSDSTTAPTATTTMAPTATTTMAPTATTTMAPTTTTVTTVTSTMTTTLTVSQGTETSPTETRTPIRNDNDGDERTSTKIALSSDQEDTETAQDSDGDGVRDSEDYAPDDPEVQEKSDLEDTSTGSTPGFGLLITIVSISATILIGVRRHNAD